MYLTLLNLLCSSISLISGQITYPDMSWSRCGRITEVGLYFVCVLSKTLVENRQYILQDHGRIIEISG